MSGRRWSGGDREQRRYGYWRYAIVPVQAKKLDYKACANGADPSASDEGNCGLDGAYCWQQIIHYDDAIFVIECILMHFQGVCSVFEFISHRKGIRG